MSRFDDAFAFVIGVEGGLSMVRSDPGNWTGGKVGEGELRGTKYGVSAASYPALDIASLTLEDAEHIYRQNYWDAIGADSLPDPLALVAFDTAVNSGVGRAKQFLTKTQDWRTFLDVRLAFLQGLSIWETFGRGWTNRVNKLRGEALRWEVALPREGTVNLINEAALAAIRGEIALPQEDGNCLMAVRFVVEKAMGWDDMELYKQLVTEKVEANKTSTWWAADAEKSMRSRGLHLDPRKESPRGGDLVFSALPNPQRHVALIVFYRGGLYALENAQIRRGQPLGGANNLVPLHMWDEITTLARLPQAEVPDKPKPPRVMLQRGPTAEEVTGKRIEIPEARGVTLNAAGETVYVAVNVGKEPPATPLPK